jgi:ATP-dependent Clp protease ATP-binding subunit ClpA
VKIIVSGVRGALAYGSSLRGQFLAGLKRVLEVVEKKGD